MVNINLRVETPSSGDAVHGDSENFSQNRKPLEENLSASGASLPEPGSEMISLQRLAVCRINNTNSGNLSAPPSPPVEEKRVRREIANSNERRRMQSINAGFQSLRALLPRRDGEKISKASILQQTADMLKTLQAEKQLLSQENSQYKFRLESAGEVPVGPTNIRPIPEDKIPMSTRHPGLIAPPKKRRKFENTAGDSSDEGVGMLSDGDFAKEPSAQIQPVLTGSDLLEKQQQPVWEMEMLRNELIKLRMSLEQERRMRLLLEDQLRAVELSRLQTLNRLPSVPLMEYSTLSTVPSISPSLFTSTVTSRPNNAVYSNSPTTTTILIPQPELQSPASIGLPQLPGTPKLTAQFHGGQQPNQPVFSNLKPITVRPAYSLTQQHSSPVVSSLETRTSTSKQSLNAIVEAIRHLEGDQLFVDVESDGKHQRVLTGLDAMRLDPAATDSGISSPVSDRLTLSFTEPAGAVRGPGVLGSQAFQL